MSSDKTSGVSSAFNIFKNVPKYFISIELLYNAFQLYIKAYSWM